MMKPTQHCDSEARLLLTLGFVLSACVLVSANVFVTLASANAHSAKVWQERERTVLLKRQFKKDPLEVIGVELGEKTIRFGESFTADENWPRQIVLQVRNRYSKPITYVQINIDLPETEATGIMMQEQKFLGQHPVYKRPVEAKALRLAPGEAMKIPLDSEYDRIKRMVELRHGPIDHITKLLIRVDEVGFEDGTIYSGDEIFRRNPDPNSSPKWLKVIE